MKSPLIAVTVRDWMMALWISPGPPASSRSCLRTLRTHHPARALSLVIVVDG